MKRFAVVGDPVRHSRSPGMHAAAYRALGLDCSYEAIVASESELEGVIGRLRSGELAGLNVTVPHKARALALADEGHPAAAVAGSSNTLVRGVDGRVVAHNTDVPALVRELDSLAGDGFDFASAHALVLGTGATACGSLVALVCHLGVPHVTLRGRSLGGADDARVHAELTRQLASGGGATELTLEPWGPHPQTDRAASIVVHATTLGMAGGGAGELSAAAVAWGVVRSDACVLDVVYASEPTPLLVAARARTRHVRDGKGVLAWQGALSFELWLGRPAPLDVMQAALSA